VARRPALGRGLKALLPDTPRARAGLAELPVDRIRPNPLQPRRRFDDAALRELAASITEHGLLQPLLVTEHGEGDYTIIAGERRWRAARHAGLTVVPVVIRERVDETAHLELALVENIQRRDLTPLEEARAYDHLRTSCGLSQADIASRVGIDRSTVANSLRLLRLDAAIQESVEEGLLSAGHARALLSISSDEERLAWAGRAASGGVTVRDLERVAAESRSPRRRRRAPEPPDPNLREAEEKLALRLGTVVRIRRRGRGGDIVIQCSDEEELMRVWERLMEEGT